jgi:hypothetical protein
MHHFHFVPLIHERASQRAHEERVAPEVIGG